MLVRRRVLCCCIVPGSIGEFGLMAAMVRGVTVRIDRNGTMPSKIKMWGIYLVCGVDTNSLQL